VRRAVHLALLLASLSALACTRKRAEKTEAPAAKASAAHADEPEHEGLPRRVKLPPSVILDARVRTAPAVKERLVSLLSLPGDITSDPERTAHASSPVPGRIARVHFREGSVVKKGDALLTLRVHDLAKIRGEHAASVAKAAAATTNAERLNGLLARGLASQQEATSATAEARALGAQARAFEEQLRVLGLGTEGAGSELTLRAPLAGAVISRTPVVGAPVGADESLATISDLSEVWFLGRVFEKDLGALRTGMRAEVQLNAYPEQHFDGTVEYISRQIDPVARTVTARVVLANRDDLLRIGLFGTARVAIDDAEPKAPTLVVERSAILEIGRKPVVFVRQKDDDFEMHEVVLGDSALGKVEVVSGLREGEQVVVEGAFTLKSLVLKSTIAEEE